MKLSKLEIEDRLKSLNGWLYDVERDAIVKNFKFKNFRDAIAFVLKVAFESEKMNHHPDILIEYNRVHLALRTHSESGVTEKDFDLAYKIDEFDFKF
ncbi:MAG: 4a-hydroxytetrahydrobiopterin dehydratase [Candidatus Kryptonium sp.]